MHRRLRVGTLEGSPTQPESRTALGSHRQVVVLDVSARTKDVAPADAKHRATRAFLIGDLDGEERCAVFVELVRQVDLVKEWSEVGPDDVNIGGKHVRRLSRDNLDRHRQVSEGDLRTVDGTSVQRKGGMEMGDARLSWLGLHAHKVLEPVSLVPPAVSACDGAHPSCDESHCGLEDVQDESGREDVDRDDLAERPERDGRQDHLRVGRFVLPNDGCKVCEVYGHVGRERRMSAVDGSARRRARAEGGVSSCRVMPLGSELARPTLGSKTGDRLQHGHLVKSAYDRAL